MCIGIDRGADRLRHPPRLPNRQAGSGQMEVPRVGLTRVRMRLIIAYEEQIGTDGLAVPLLCCNAPIGSLILSKEPHG